MNTVVIYKSKYGSTETYAKWLAEDLDADLLQADRVKPADLQRYETIVYGGGIYAGSVNGIALLTKNFESIRDKSLYLFTVGAADVNAPETPKAIRHALEQKLPPALWEKLHIYHLRGGMQFSKLSLLHRIMMRMFIKMLSKKPQEELSADEKGMLDTISRDTDFTNREAIAPLVEEIRAGIC